MVNFKISKHHKICNLLFPIGCMYIVYLSIQQLKEHFQVVLKNLTLKQ